jgi:hypothetical protein
MLELLQLWSHNADGRSVEVGLTSGREAPMPHPAIGVHALRRLDDLRDGKVDIVGIADARSDAAEARKCSMDLRASS